MGPGAPGVFTASRITIVISCNEIPLLKLGSSADQKRIVWQCPYPLSWNHFSQPSRTSSGSISSSCTSWRYQFTKFSLVLRSVSHCFRVTCLKPFNPLKPELNPICYLLALLGAHHFLHVSRIRVKLLNFRRLMLYIYGARILDVSRSHTTTQHSR